MARPRIPLLNQRVIVTAALELLDRHGDFTMSSLAAALGVRPSSLYNHVASKTQVISLIRSEWLGSLVAEVAETPRGPERLRRLMVRYYEQVQAIPTLVPLLYREELDEDESFRFYDEIAACVREIGGTPEDATAMIALIDGFVLGSALDTLAPAFNLDEDAQSTHTALAWTLDRGRSTRTRGIGDFTRGTDIVIAGLVSRLIEEKREDHDQ